MPIHRQVKESPGCACAMVSAHRHVFLGKAPLENGWCNMAAVCDTLRYGACGGRVSRLLVSGCVGCAGKPRWSSLVAVRGPLLASQVQCPRGRTVLVTEGHVMLEADGAERR